MEHSRKERSCILQHPENLSEAKFERNGLICSGEEMLRLYSIWAEVWLLLTTLLCSQVSSEREEAEQKGIKKCSLVGKGVLTK